MKKHVNIKVELDVLGCMHNADFENKIVNDNIMLDLVIIYQNFRHVVTMI